MTNAKKFLGESLIRDDRPTLLLAAYRPFTPLTREDQTTEPLTVATRAIASWWTGQRHTLSLTGR